MKQHYTITRIFLLLAVSLLPYGRPLHACTRVAYQGPDGLGITARSMDSKDNIPANLWVFPRGMERTGEAGPASLRCPSRYGNVATGSFALATTDGMNGKGLVANVRRLTESKHPDVNQLPARQSVAISVRLQYILDNFATVDEAGRALRTEAFVVTRPFRFAGL